MSYQGEFASYQPLKRIAEEERVRKLLQSAKVSDPVSDEKVYRIKPAPAPESDATLPSFAIAIDGSPAEIPVKNGYPGAHVSYCSVASVLLDLDMISELDKERPINPVEFRKTEEAAAIDAAFPGSNVIINSHTSAQDSFRETLYNTLRDIVVDDEDKQTLLSTYEALLAFKPSTHLQECPYVREGCEEKLLIPAGISECRSTKKPIYSTDALRIHEGFRDIGTNQEVLTETMQVLERVLLIHLLRGFESRKLLSKANRIAFFVDGPLAVFGHPAWLSQSISKELKRINQIVREKTGHDLLITGIEKTGEFVEHFMTIDQTERPGEKLFQPGEYALPDDRYIKERIIFSDSKKRYGADTYFGRKFFYKTKGGALIVASIAFLNDVQDTLESSEVALYPEFGPICKLFDKLASSRYPNSLAPIISAHAQAAIPLNLGRKVLEQLSRALMRK